MWYSFSVLFRSSLTGKILMVRSYTTPIRHSSPCTLLFHNQYISFFFRHFEPPLTETFKYLFLFDPFSTSEDRKRTLFTVKVISSY